MLAIVLKRNWYGIGEEVLKPSKHLRLIKKIFLIPRNFFKDFFVKNQVNYNQTEL